VVFLTFSLLLSFKQLKKYKKTPTQFNTLFGMVGMNCTFLSVTSQTALSNAKNALHAQEKLA